MGSLAYLPVVQNELEMPSDAETLTQFTPSDPAEQAVEDYVNAHPLVAQLRADPTLIESRPLLKVPVPLRSYNLTAGTLLGKGRVAVPPLAWGDAAGTRYVQIAHLGHDLCGHPGVVHGGMLATLLDEGLARCCFPALPHHIGMTAYLNITYKAPTPAGSYVVLRAETVRVEGRKAWVEGRLETLVGEGETPVVLATAEALFVSPKHAAMMAKLHSP